ncbi:glucose dehydrogenase [Escherichia coli]|uniref:Glucose dehydrogenase n=1 Tax=Escherichia coli TaxID=562 RepID=A0A376YFB5_ECOLX|nr:glucose dehydrogenase [Escherichia coli]
MIPAAKDPNAIPSDEHTFTFNSPNSWAPAAYDAKLDLVYLPMGVTTPDIWGGNRTPEQERYASSILALNATTGKLAWSYQTVHHDLWDMIFRHSRRWRTSPLMVRKCQLFTLRRKPATFCARSS